MGPVTWGKWFNALLDRKGIPRGRGGDRRSEDFKAKNFGFGNDDPVKREADAQGVTDQTARNRMALATELEGYPTLREWVDGPTKFPQQAEGRELPEKVRRRDEQMHPYQVPTSSFAENKEVGTPREDTTPKEES